MAVGNEELMHQCFPQTLTHGNSKNEIRQQKTVRKREVSMERSKVDTKEKRSPDGLDYHNQNTIIINIIC